MASFRCLRVTTCTYLKYFTICEGVKDPIEWVPGFAVRGSFRYFLLSRVADSPDRVRPVVAHQQRAVGSFSHANRASPHVAIRQHEAGKEVFILTAGVAGLVQRHSDHFIPHTHRLVP